MKYNTDTNLIKNAAKNEVAKISDEMLRPHLTKAIYQIKMKNEIYKDIRKYVYRGLVLLSIAVSIIFIQILIGINANHKYNNLMSDYISLKSEYDEIAKSYNELKLQQGIEDLEVVPSEEFLDMINVSELKGVTFTYDSNIPLPEELQKYAYDKCVESNIDYYVFLGLMMTESRFNYDAKSYTNDYGLCQINKINHDWMKEVFGNNWDPLDPYHSIDASIYIMNYLIDTFDYTTYHSLLMGYNMGPKNARKCFDKGIYSSEYSREVMGYATEYGYTGNGDI